MTEDLQTSPTVLESATNEELIQMFRSGNPEALELLQERCIPIVEDIAARLAGGFTRNKKAVGREEFAEEVASTAKKKVLSKLHQYEGKSKFKAWVYCICFNTARDVYRKYNKTRSKGPRPTMVRFKEGTESELSKSPARRPRPDVATTLIQKDILTKLTEHHEKEYGEEGILSIRVIKHQAAGYSIAETSRDLAITTDRVKRLRKNDPIRLKKGARKFGITCPEDLYET